MLEQSVVRPEISDVHSWNARTSDSSPTAEKHIRYEPRVLSQEAGVMSRKPGAGRGQLMTPKSCSRIS